MGTWLDELESGYCVQVGEIEDIHHILSGHGREASWDEKCHFGIMEGPLEVEDACEWA